MLILSIMISIISAVTAIGLDVSGKHKSKHKSKYKKKTLGTSRRTSWAQVVIKSITAPRQPTALDQG